MNGNGKLITIEGCEGVGKSTQTRMLKEYCEKNGIDAFFTREPGGTEIAEKIRNVILDSSHTAMDSITELLLYIASRRQHTAQLIAPKLQSGTIVFCDRYIDSTTAYQGYGRGLDIKIIDRLNELAMGDVKICATLFLDIEPFLGFLRKGGADKSDRLENEGLVFHEKVYQGFKQIEKNNKERFINIDCRGTKDQTHGQIIKELKERMIF